MKKVEFSTTIHAPREKVWRILWDDATYRAWTAPFHSGSYAVSDWKEGGKVHFLTPDGHGMYSKIARLIPNEYMSFEHQGDIKDGVEQPIDPQGWAGAQENYSLHVDGEGTRLVVEVDSTDEFFTFLQEAFPKALDKVKELAEA